MLRLTATACIEAPAEVVWAHLSQLDQIHVWTDLIHHSHMSSGASCGVGAERTCDLVGGRSNHERVIAWDEGRSFTYESTDAPLMKLARNTWSVAPMGGRSLVTSAAEMQFHGGWLGQALGSLFLPVLKLLLPNPFSRFKFWVENGRPYEGKSSSLPVPSAVC